MCKVPAPDIVFLGLFSFYGYGHGFRSVLYPLQPAFGDFAKKTPWLATELFLLIYFRHSSVAGIGVFAARRLVPGDVIMVEDPVLVTKFGTIETTDQFNRMYADLHRQLKELAPSTQVTELITVVWIRIRDFLAWSDPE